MIAYLKNPKESTRKLIEVITEFMPVVRDKFTEINCIPIC